MLLLLEVLVLQEVLLLLEVDHQLLQPEEVVEQLLDVDVELLHDLLTGWLTGLHCSWGLSRISNLI